MQNLVLARQGGLDMRYVVIDIETTGLDEETCQLIEFGAVYDDQSLLQTSVLPTFHRYLYYDLYQGEPYAIWLNAGYFEKRKKLGKEESYDNWVKPEDLLKEFYGWLDMIPYKPKKILVAGKNYKGFDEKFLSRLPGYDERAWHHRHVDPAMCFTNFRQDEEPPALDECLKRAGIKKSVAHTALEDAVDVAMLLRRAGDRQRCMWDD